VKNIIINQKTLRTKATILILSFLFSVITSWSQATKIDSLKAIVRKAIVKSEPNKADIKAAIFLSDYYSKYSIDSAKHYGFAAYNIAKIVGNQTGIAVSLNSIGMLYQICGYYDSAVPYLDSSRAMFANIGDQTGLVFVRNNLALAMVRKGNYAEGLKYYQENLDYAKSNNELENMVLAYNNMGIAYFDWEKYRQALKYYHLALHVLDDLKEEERTGPVYNNIGEAYFDMGEMDKAYIYFSKAQVINQKYGKKRSILISMINIGKIHFTNKEYDKAYANFREALVISESIPDLEHIALINIRIGILFNTLNKYTEAKPYLTKGLSVALANGKSKTVLEAYRAFIEYSRGVKDAEKVYEYGRLYINLNDSLFNESSLNKISELETKYKTAEKENEIVILKSDQQLKELEIQLQKNLKYSLLVLILILLLTSLLLFNRYKLKKEKENSEIEKARIKIEQRLLHSQMNPHFIFNSLNSINSFIGENNAKEAQAYLIKFAKLMRLILENSRKVMVALEDEIHALKLNMELEKLRFNDSFDFKIVIDPNIDPEYIYLPPMLIQPFIENAIMHGIKGKDDKGLVTLTIKAEKEFLNCVVEDNGVGRKKTIKIANSKKDHVSLGTQVTIERLEILRQEITPKAGMQIIDLIDENDHGIGTQVILHIPYEED